MKQLAKWLIVLLMPLVFFVGSQQVSARSFGGHMGTTHVTRSVGNSHLNGKTYRLNRSSNRQYKSVSHNYQTNRRQSSGLGTMFGHSIVRGAGWSIGSHMGNSLWHTLFGVGGNSYYSNGQEYSQQPGYSGLIIVVILIIIAIFVIKFIRNRRYHY